MSIKQSVQALADPARAAQPLPPAPAVGAKPGAVGVGRQQASVGGGGELEEADYTQREYWTTVNVMSTDGLLTIQEYPIKSVLLTNGSRFPFKQPT